MADKDYCGGKRDEDPRGELGQLLQLLYSSLSYTFMLIAELGEIREDASLVEANKSEDHRVQEVVQIFMKSLDRPGKISVEDAANIAALKMQVLTA